MGETEGLAREGLEEGKHLSLVAELAEELAAHAVVVSAGDPPCRLPPPVCSHPTPIKNLQKLLTIT